RHELRGNRRETARLVEQSENGHSSRARGVEKKTAVEDERRRRMGRVARSGESVPDINLKILRRNERTRRKTTGTTGPSRIAEAPRIAGAGNAGASRDAGGARQRA